jgi:imidazolonepropionase-like amidohydrolase
MKSALLVLTMIATVASSAFGQERTAIVNVTVIDGTDNPPREHSVVLVQGHQIVSVTSGGARKRRFPDGTTVTDGTGKYLIPGLWNNDLHGPSYSTAEPLLKELVSYGITTVRDMGAPLSEIVRVRDATASGALLGPRLFIAGPLMEGPIPIKMDLIVGLFSSTQAQEQVLALKQAQVDYVEVDTSLTPELYASVAEEAKKQHLPLVGHIPADVSARDIVAAGQVNVEHLGGRYLNILIACSSDEPYFRKIIAKTFDESLAAMKEKRPVEEPQFTAAFATRLLSSFDSNKAQQLYSLYAANHIAQTPTLHVLRTLWETNKESHNLTAQDLQLGEQIFAKDLAVIGEMKRAGVPILAGTDGPYVGGGDALHDELQLLVRAGLSPKQAIQAASRDAAEAMGVLAKVGTVESGKDADFVILDANPLQNIANTRRIDAVCLHGHLFSRTQLDALRAK